MVLLNYEQFIKQKINQEIYGYTQTDIIKACKMDSFYKFLVKLYEYCEQINIIEQRMKILAQQTQKIKGMKPKLLQSQTIKVGQKIKQIGSIYSIFLIQQKKYKVFSEENQFFQQIYKIIIRIIEKCFTKTNFAHLEKQINRLIRTNTFNRKLCWSQFLQKSTKNPQLSVKKKKMSEFNYNSFRRSVMSQKSDIRPYVNNKSCIRSKFTRSPMITLLYPNNEYLEFDLRKKQKKKLFG